MSLSVLAPKSNPDPLVSDLPIFDRACRSRPPAFPVPPVSLGPTSSLSPSQNDAADPKLELLLLNLWKPVSFSGSLCTSTDLPFSTSAISSTLDIGATVLEVFFNALDSCHALRLKLSTFSGASSIRSINRFIRSFSLISSPASSRMTLEDFLLLSSSLVSFLSSSSSPSVVSIWYSHACSSSDMRLLEMKRERCFGVRHFNMCSSLSLSSQVSCVNVSVYP
mmetsp:Transcript_48828/g.121989  ORF Transcript_48828/g.121989 Transcript_48828/m.121989 type:complete len:222 (+) Transcript_48828:597-1262(+)